jgi:hypothetical protein
MFRNSLILGELARRHLRDLRRRELNARRPEVPRIRLERRMTGPFICNARHREEA